MLLFLTGPLQYLPRCVLASIVFTIAVGMIDVKGLRNIRRESPGEFYLAVVTAAAVVAIGVEQGILLAIALSIFRHVRHSYSPHAMLLAPDVTGRWVPGPATPGKETEPGLIVYRFGLDPSAIRYWSKGSTEEPYQLPAGAMRILVVDADEAIRRSAHHLLGVQGATVETARDGHEALALMRQTPYSCALVDIRLPDLNGYEIYHRLREIQPQTPIILMTGFGYDPTHSIVKARQEGLQTVLYKPFRAERLMEAVEQALRIHQPPPPLPLPLPRRRADR